MTLLINQYQIDFELRELKFFKLFYSTSDVFPQNEIDFIETFYPLLNKDYDGCFYDFTPRQVKIYLINQEWIQFILPFRGNTQEYLEFIQKMGNINNFLRYEIIPEKVPYRTIKKAFIYG